MTLQTLNLEGFRHLGAGFSAHPAGLALALARAAGTGWTAAVRRRLEHLEARLAPVLLPRGRRTGQNGRR